MGVGGWLIGGRLVGWLLVVGCRSCVRFWVGYWRFFCLGIMGVGSWLIAGRLFGRWLLVVAHVSAFGLLVGWLLLVVCCRLVVGCWLSLLCPLLGRLLVGCCWSSVVDWWVVVGQPP